MGCQGQLVLTLATELGFNIEVMLLDGQLEDHTYDVMHGPLVQPCYALMLHTRSQVVKGLSVNF